MESLTLSFVKTIFAKAEQFGLKPIPDRCVESGAHWRDENQCHKYYWWGYLGKSLIAALAIMTSPSLPAISQSSPLTDEGELLSIHREIKRVEAESLRVAVTIDALEEQLHEYPNPETVEQIHAELGDLYKYDIRLAAHYTDINKVWNYLQNPHRKYLPTQFDADQSKPIPRIQEGVYEGLPDDAIPITDFSPIIVDYIYKDLIHSKSNPATRLQSPPIR